MSNTSTATESQIRLSCFISLLRSAFG